MQFEIQAVKLEAIWVRFGAEIIIEFNGFVLLTVTKRQELGTICSTIQLLTLAVFLSELCLNQKSRKHLLSFEILVRKFNYLKNKML